jgi:hypothetical protein
MFDTAYDFVDPIAKSLRTAYTDYQQAVAAFPFNQLTLETNLAFSDVVERADSWLEASVRMAEQQALDHIWWRDIYTGIRGPRTPADETMEMSLQMSVKSMQEAIRVADQQCLEPLIPLIIPSFQPFTDVIIAAARNLVPQIPAEFSSSVQRQLESLEATTSFVNLINLCASASTTDNCVRNFVNRNKSELCYQVF